MEGDPGMDSVTQLGEGEARSLRTRLVDLEALLGIANDEIRSAENTVAAAMGQVEELLEMSKTVEEECTTAVERVEQDVMKGVEKDFADLRVKHDDHHESRWEEYHRTLRLETDALKAVMQRYDRRINAVMAELTSGKKAETC